MFNYMDERNKTGSKLRIGAVRRSFWCRLGFHNWYIGSYSSPVWGRTERRCMDCDEKQHRTYKPLGWKSY